MSSFYRHYRLPEAVRKDLDPMLMSHIIVILSDGLVTIGDFRRPEELSPYEAAMEMIADMLDRLLTPEDGGDIEVSKASIR
jgi:hypothetical protein